MILFKHKFMSLQAAKSFLKYFLQDFVIIKEEPVNAIPDSKCYVADNGHKIYLAINEYNDAWVYETSE